MQIGHNQEKDPEQMREDKAFLDAYSQIKSAESQMAGLKGESSAIYKRIQNIGGWTKADIKFAQSLEDKDVGQVIADFERKIRIAKLFGHRLGRQLSLLDEDRSPQADRAYEEGWAAGSLRKQATNPYDAEAGQRWQSGFNDGTAFINQKLDEELSEDDPD